MNPLDEYYTWPLPNSEGWAVMGDTGYVDKFVRGPDAYKHRQAQHLADLLNEHGAHRVAGLTAENTQLSEALSEAEGDLDSAQGGLHALSVLVEAIYKFFEETDPETRISLAEEVANAASDAGEITGRSDPIAPVQLLLDAVERRDAKEHEEAGEANHE